MQVVRQGEGSKETEDRFAAAGMYLSSISHAINNVLGNISLHANAVLTLRKLPNADEELIDRSLRAIIQYSRRCSSMLKAVRRYVTETEGEKEENDLNAIVAGVVEEHRFFCESNDVRVLLQLENGPLELMMHRAGIELLVTQLLYNSVEAIVPERGTVVVSTVREGNALLLKVRDDGRGASDQALARAFDPFVTFNRSSPNIGLGLTLSRAVAEAHDGTIRLKRNEETGMTAEVTFPLPRQADLRWSLLRDR